ncbi:MAG: septal ring lytic transglycosylase RlpA family protein [Pseudomonadota bacterium]
MRFVAWLICRYTLVLLLVSLLNACSHAPEKPGSSEPSSTSQNERYPGKAKDWGPKDEIDMSGVPDATPRYEMRTIAGNKNPYTILGKTYQLMEDERSYKERGKASWYGYKFNGEHTSNGELYNMFSMTAAHKTLPIPSYVRVTNLANNKSVVVRVNDRGPFHSDRIVDLSYAAAQRLGITQAGTGDVEVEIVVPDDDPRPPLRGRKNVAAGQAINTTANASFSKEAAGIASGGILPSGTYLQIAAFSAEKSAQQLIASIADKLSYPVIISALANPNNLYRVRVGPFKDAQILQNAREQLQKINILQAHVVYQ